ncbi:thiamine pyrophosphate-binding protein [Dactylosporangium fulvum]|uniref:Thiamine pyrophosphate-binding protein n=1 Tax=Dactylosporangium fulvum TaxID=53359 RepID=A0ABY5W6X2_9ACTN|nr:thiamine pyrophosphate-binding protein [Dactylosporangium fulvum]UWP85637.1 thiamine pyrophosphate-binding protein [Dactylosporangium fulvum]
MNTETAGYARLVEALKCLGVREMFGVMGVGNMHMIGEFRKGGGRYVATRHEAGAVNMADGQARATGGLGVATVIQGPGLTNALTALTTAVRSASPVLVVTSELPVGRRPTGQAIDQEPLVAGTGAAYLRVTETDPGATLVEAAELAMRERRPVVVSVPGSVQQRTWAPVPLTRPTVPRHRAPVDEGDVVRLAELFSAATHPVVVAGRGAEWSGAGDAVAALAERTGALLGTTALLKDRFHSHPADIGVVGGFSHPLARELLGAADLVVALGASLSVWTIARGGLFPHATLVQCDKNADAIGAQARPHHGIVADVRDLVESLLPRLPERGAAPARWAAEGAFDRLAQRRPEEGFTDRSGDGRIDPRTASMVLDRELPADRVLTVDGGHYIGFPTEFITVPEPHRYQFTLTFGAIGQALGVAIGAAVARPGPSHVCVIGDGGLATSIADLDTLVREAIPLLVVVFNDMAYGAEIHHLRHEGLPDDIARFSGPDMVEVAAGFGCEARRATTAGELADAIHAWSGEAPMVIDVAIDGEVLAPWYAEVLDPPQRVTTRTG